MNKRNYEPAMKLLGTTKPMILTEKDRQMLKNQLKYWKDMGLLPRQIKQGIEPPFSYDQPMNQLAHKAIREMGVPLEPDPMPVLQLINLGLRDPDVGRVSHKEDLQELVDELELMGADEALEWIEAASVPKNFNQMNWKALAGSLINWVEDLRNELENG